MALDQWFIKHFLFPFIMDYNCVILRNAEIGLKSRRKRPYFERSLQSAVQEGLSRYLGGSIPVKNFGLRLVVYSDAVTQVLPVLSFIPGIYSFSPARHFSFSSKEDIISTITQHAKELVKDKTFRVSVSRTGSHTFSSIDLTKELGAKLLSASKGVDLHNPQVNVQLEVRNADCFLYTDSFNGLGGAPSATTGKALMLFSGGIDSPIASFQLLKRGCALDYVHIDLVGESAFAQVIPVYNYIITTYAYNQNPRLFYLPAKKLSDYITKNVQPELRQLALKVAFYQIANKLCKQDEYFAFATGEALSQKSTQTLPSLCVLNNYAHHLVLRPLIDKDKLEIISVAKKIGTWAYSTQVKEACNLSDGPVFAVPRKEDMEKIPDFTSLIDELFKGMKIYDGVVPQESFANKKTDSFSSAQVIDVRLPAQFAKLPFDDVVVMTFTQATEFIQFATTSQPLIFICEHGVLSEELALLFSKRGGKAQSMTPITYKKIIEGENI